MTDNKGLALTFCASLADAAARILGVVTLAEVNTVLATVIAGLSIVHLLIKIRKETRSK